MQIAKRTPIVITARATRATIAPTQATLHELLPGWTGATEASVEDTEMKDLAMEEFEHLPATEPVAKVLARIIASVVRKNGPA